MIYTCVVDGQVTTIDESDSIEFILLKNKEELSKYYIDNDGDVWENKVDFELWDNNSTEELELFIDKDNFGELVIVKEKYELLSEDYKWAVDAYITRKQNPEYFL